MESSNSSNNNNTVNDTINESSVPNRTSVSYTFPTQTFTTTTTTEDVENQTSTTTTVETTIERQVEEVEEVEVEHVENDSDDEPNFTVDEPSESENEQNEGNTNSQNFNNSNNNSSQQQQNNSNANYIHDFLRNTFSNLGNISGTPRAFNVEIPNDGNNGVRGFAVSIPISVSSNMSSANIRDQINQFVNMNRNASSTNNSSSNTAGSSTTNNEHENRSNVVIEEVESDAEVDDRTTEIPVENAETTPANNNDTENNEQHESTANNTTTEEANSNNNASSSANVQNETSNNASSSSTNTNSNGNGNRFNFFEGLNLNDPGIEVTFQTIDLNVPQDLERDHPYPHVPSKSPEFKPFKVPDNYASYNNLDGKELQTCSICLEEMDQKKHALTRLVCGHEFHMSCVGSWFNSIGLMKCPNCNSVQDDQPGGWRYADNNQPHITTNTTTFRDLFGGQNANIQEIPELNTLPNIFQYITNSVMRNRNNNNNNNNENNNNNNNTNENNDGNNREQNNNESNESNGNNENINVSEHNEAVQENNENVTETHDEIPVPEALNTQQNESDNIPLDGATTSHTSNPIIEEVDDDEEIPSLEVNDSDPTVNNTETSDNNTSSNINSNSNTNTNSHSNTNTNANTNPFNIPTTSFDFGPNVSVNFIDLSSMNLGNALGGLGNLATLAGLGGLGGLGGIGLGNAFQSFGTNAQTQAQTEPAPAEESPINIVEVTENESNTESTVNQTTINEENVSLPSSSSFVNPTSSIGDNVQDQTNNDVDDEERKSTLANQHSNSEETLHNIYYDLD